ncbi:MULTISPECIES: hypothetical protein [unclassified Gordonia (in: high G+C Gram-positive bacteria)]|uniref:hypothetical protein n=1 Tax=unclassified Gordonia (in: high G+C Gram-positive bacteria) TaxID=2657482 RepID=UPI001F11749C|nr:hypothetical protein [Gordonia sp. ABSL49_1]MCH5641704.1 hypothetical protein [Gordonia sp. ABSL49_1]
MASELIGRTGVVTLAIGGPDVLGEVELTMAAGTERFLARASESITEDVPVLVVDVEAGRIVVVEPWVSLPH